MRSHLLVGTVRHRRSRPMPYASSSRSTTSRWIWPSSTASIAGLRLVGRNRRQRRLVPR